MRQALGLGDDATGHRPQPRFDQERRGRRFVRDGEVPVIVVNGSRDGGSDPARPVNRAAAAEAALRTERAAREHAERSLSEALANLQGLRTQLVHADMSHAESLAAEREARAYAEMALTDANATVAALQARLDEAQRAQDLAAEKAAARVVERTVMPPRPRGRPRKVLAASATIHKAAPTVSHEVTEVDEAEPEPVKWWLPSYKAKARNKA